MKYLVTIFFYSIVISTLSAQPISNRKQQQSRIFNLEKIVITAVTEDTEARVIFEKTMKNRLKSYHINAYQSMEIYPMVFTTPEKTEEEMNSLIRSIRKKGFDGLMITSTTRLEEKYDTIYGHSKIYHIETHIYTLIPKNLSLLWEMCLDIYDYQLGKLTTNDYIDAIIMQMKYDGILPMKTAINQFPIKN